VRQTAIVNARIFDGTGRPVIEDAVLLAEDGAIAAVGPAADVSVPPEAQVLDAAGHTVLPGLIDGHMHVTAMPGPLDARGHLEQNLRAVGVLRRCLRWGTTTVANVSGCPETVLLREAIAAGHITGCSRLLVGAMVNATAGHVRGRAADGPWEVRRAVREMIGAGADFIKTAASGGFMWEHEDIAWEDYTPEELRALVEEAHARGTRVAVHAHSQPGLNHSLEAGCDIIAHGALIDEEGLQGLRARGLYFMPTLFITSRHVTERPSLPPHMKQRMEAAHPVHRAGVRRAHELGLKLCAGTDGGPGDIMRELAELVACGLSPREGLVTATRNTAEALGLLDALGTLEPGKQADLLLVRGDPLHDIGLLGDEANVLTVMRGGVVEFGRHEWKQHVELV